MTTIEELHESARAALKAALDNGDADMTRAATEALAALSVFS